MKIEEFAGRSPELKPEEFLAGKLEGWGVIEGPLGGLQSRYSISASGSWDAGASALRFVETWRFDDGHADTLSWLIRPLGDGNYTGTEDRLVGDATGEQAGPAFHWKYTRETPQADGGTIKLDFDDWFWRIDATGVVVRGRALKVGLPIATAHVTYRKIG